jgi:hypothetical protein
MTSLPDQLLGWLFDGLLGWLNAHSIQFFGVFLAERFVQLSHHKGKGWGGVGIYPGQFVTSAHGSAC